ncbi:cyclic GMP-AMP synthase-like receptor [Aethina tumida]|uniref:Cyclic GMP-AMP synthase-like receptor n=1 Tax=Aethina tumida TaxID=116153 RepID=CGLR_AETTU|nr:cyclic GMP-AMP synthase-like receptor [Aethina tumida]
MNKYNYMENVLQHINANVISLRDDEIKGNNIILKEILNIIIDKLKTKNIMFRKMYTCIFFGGSYYDGLRVGHPNEFDLDLLLTLHNLTKPIITKANEPGYVFLKLGNINNFLNIDDFKMYKQLSNLINKNGYLDVRKVLSWFEGIVTSSLNDIKEGSIYNFQIKGNTYKGTIHKGGPAFTLKIKGPNGSNMDIDLVPCFRFTEEHWPQGFKKSTSQQKSFFIVPKPLPDSTKSHYWRLSFQEQERELINNKGRLKPALRLLKQMRDTLNHHRIASYYLKTVFLWQVEEIGVDQSHWNSSLSYVFVCALKRYKEFLDSDNLPYFWEKKNNLLSGLHEDTLKNIRGSILKVLTDIESNNKDPNAIVKYLLTPEEQKRIMNGGNPQQSANAENGSCLSM